MPSSDTLPRPRAVLRIGITGHRLNKLTPEGRTTVRASLADTLTAIEAETRGALEAVPSLPYAAASPELRIVSALAEGADRFAVEAAPAHWPVHAILPMPVAEYERDFASAEPGSTSLSEFRSLLGRAAEVVELPLVGGADEPDRPQQYDLLATFLARHVDILVAVWDGLAASGPGGTAMAVTRGLAEGAAVVWINANQPDDVRLLTGFADLDIEQPQAEPLDKAVLGAAVTALLGGGRARAPEAAGPRDAPGHGSAHGGADDEDPPRYLVEPWPTRLRWALAYPLLRRLSGAGSPPLTHVYPPLGAVDGGWERFFAVLHGTEAGSPKSPRPAAMRDILLPRSAWADTLALYHSHLYRSAYVTVFTLAGLAVPVGLLYLFLQDSPAILDIKAGFVALELLIIAAVVLLVRVGTREHWHRSWIETRELSELLRLSRPLACIGALADLPGVAPGPAHGSFPLWYARATIREIGLVSATLDGPYLRRVLAATLETDIAEQRAYHEANARNLSRIDHFLHVWGNRCFGATIAVLAAYLALWLLDAAVSTGHAAAPGGHAGGLHAFLHEVLKPLASVLAAGLPALGAALAGIRAQGDFGEAARRSAATQAELLAVEDEIRTVLASPLPGPSLARATDILVAATRIMMNDVQAWRQTYVSKALTLPA